MPEVSQFYGIQIYFYYRDHLPPHFHAIYGDEEALIRIADLGLESGWLPKRAMRLVQEWGALHQVELTLIWDLARAQQPLGKISPLS